MRIINSPWTIVIVAVSLSLALLSFFAFHEYIPTVTKTAYARDLADKYEAEANKMKQAQNRVKTAIAMVNQSSVAWDRYVATKTPPMSVAAGGINIGVQPYKLLIDTFEFRNSVQRAVNHQVLEGGVKLVGSAPYVPVPQDVNNTGTLLADYYNYPSFKFPIVIFNLGTVTVQGTYDEIMRNVRSYRNMPHYLAVADGLRIDGTSPNLVGTYQLSVVGFIRGNKIWGAVPEEVSSSASGAGGGGAGGSFGPPRGGGFPGARGGGGPGFGAPPGAGPPPGVIPGGGGK